MMPTMILMIFFVSRLEENGLLQRQMYDKSANGMRTVCEGKLEDSPAGFRFADVTCIQLTRDFVPTNSRKVAPIDAKAKALL